MLTLHHVKDMLTDILHMISGTFDVAQHGANLKQLVQKLLLIDTILAQQLFPDVFHPLIDAMIAFRNGKSRLAFSSMPMRSYSIEIA